MEPNVHTPQFFTLIFLTPICAKKVRNNVTAYKYRNGIIYIAGETYQFYSMKDAIKIWRSKH